MSQINYLNVTELAGDEVTSDQVSRFYQRYGWASTFCEAKDVLEIACGTGPGLGFLASKSKSLVAGDYSNDVLSVAKNHYGERIKILNFDAQSTPFGDSSFDVIILFEALYYLPNADKFFEECRRLLRPNGVLLLATANCSLYDFNPSPYSTKYFTVPELHAALSEKGFKVECFGGSPISKSSFKGKALRFVKKIAVTFNLIPGSMKGKKYLKRLVFGKLVQMPKELMEKDLVYIQPKEIDREKEDFVHQVLYFKATLQAKN